MTLLSKSVVGVDKSEVVTPRPCGVCSMEKCTAPCARPHLATVIALPTVR